MKNPKHKSINILCNFKELLRPNLYSDTLKRIVLQPIIPSDIGIKKKLGAFVKTVKLTNKWNKCFDFNGLYNAMQTHIELFDLCFEKWG